MIFSCPICSAYPRNSQPTGTSFKFVNMMVKALENFQKEHAVSLDKITRIPLEGEGTIDRRVDR